MKKLLCSLLVMTGAAAVSGGAAQAQSTQFVTFSNFTNGEFKFLNSGSASSPSSFFTINNTGDITPQIIPVQFKFLTANAYGPANTTVNATLKLTTSANTAASQTGTLLDQGVQNLWLQFIADTPVNGKSDLLTVTAATGDITGKNGGTKANLTGSDGRGNNVTFASDFLDFGNTVTDNDSLGLTLNDVLGKNADGYLNTFTATGTGNFSAKNVAPAPEAGSLEAFAGMLALGGVILMGRRAIISFQPTE